jgi:hypothetical protein
LLTIAMVGAAGLAQAQSINAPAASAAGSMTTPAGGQERYQAQMSAEPTYPVAITDEYGFRYNSMGDRLDARGHVIAPPVTKPGAAALR